MQLMPMQIMQTMPTQSMQDWAGRKTGDVVRKAVQSVFKCGPKHAKVAPVTRLQAGNILLDKEGHTWLGDFVRGDAFPAEAQIQWDRDAGLLYILFNLGVSGQGREGCVLLI